MDFDWQTYLIQLEIKAGVGAIMQTIKNPASQKAQLVKASLIELADDIYVAYGITPPQHE